LGRGSNRDVGTVFIEACPGIRPVWDEEELPVLAASPRGFLFYNWKEFLGMIQAARKLKEAGKTR
jgi:hypothetical protein